MIDKEAFRITSIGPERGDCTSHYFISVYDNVTVEDVVKQILHSTKEWGDIRIIPRKGSYNYSHSIEYAYGKLKDASQEEKDYWDKEIRHSKVLSMWGDGGWSNSDYYLEIETPFEKEIKDEGKSLRTTIVKTITVLKPESTMQDNGDPNKMVTVAIGVRSIDFEDKIVYTDDSTGKYGFDEVISFNDGSGYMFEGQL